MSYQDTESKLEDIWRELIPRYIEKTKRSRELFELARKVLPGGSTYHIRYFKPYPIVIERGYGSRVRDVDGNVYDDYWMGHGAHILGHAPSIVINAVNEISKRGTHLGFENPYAIEYAKLLSRVVPGLEMVRFTNSGTEACMYALRLARAYTGRRYVVKIEGGWHGGYDALHVGVSPPYRGPESLGLLEDYIRYTLVVPFNDLEALENALKSYDVAAVFIEPVLGAGGCIAPEKGYLEGVRKLVDEYGALLVFDEVITGFRLALGGAQEFFNVRADIVVLGKIVGGGYPGAGAFGGRTEIMELLDQVKRPRARERSFHGGTFTGNPITMVAGYTLINYLANNRSMYDELNSLWSYIARKLDNLCEEFERTCWITGVGSMIGIHFTKEKPINARTAEELRWSHKVYEVLHLYMRINGILYLTERMSHLLPSMTHSKDQAEKLVNTFAQFLELISKKLGK